ncbi:PQQ-dependent sugar dehydrogenase [Pseudaminobacter sp. 19-2017]|uniref:PQQ-dependent sugar dehydrogenase n=1 Tax=Pseudaminobacter soli (ex Zhang et al. 2022) TaxID=2831468 RepID=A0A942I3V2_9HYPH|nr:PQQ-dependent sugar dehydrogenase [Pseudaminobacter soli]MBS3650928.1 PQQ-dependent sugar dehydrogenase [Pseudaminobacter soli]
MSRTYTLLVALTATLFSMAFVLGASAQSSPPLQTDVIVRGLEHPWGVAFLPDGHAIVTERPGRIRILSDGKLSKPVKGVPKVAARGQGGLLDIAVSPNFASDNLVYFSFSQPGRGGSGTAAARAKLVRDGANARLENVQIIFSMKKKTRSTLQFGSRLVFAPDGTLFITTGDRGDAPRAQDLQDAAGSVVRIQPDGSIPPDNPTWRGKPHLPEIWSKGHRNIQGAVFDPLTHRLLTNEHGAKGGDEINQPEAGKNYGWPVISYGREYSGAKIGVGTAAPGYEQPLHYWNPSIAPSGMAVYEGDMFPEWKGNLLIGSLKFEYLARLERDGSGKIGKEHQILKGEFGRIRDVRITPDGSIWLLTDEEDGAIVRVSRGK